MNMDESVARGCAFECAMISPLFRVKEVQVADYVPYPIAVTWDIKGADAMEVEEGETGGAGGNVLTIVRAGSSFPSTKRITFKSAEVGRLCRCWSFRRRRCCCCCCCYCCYCCRSCRCGCCYC
jgi:hypothetical protein